MLWVSRTRSSYDIALAGGITTALFGGEGLFVTTLTGPGKVVLQSMDIAKIAATIIPYLPSAGTEREITYFPFLPAHPSFASRVAVSSCAFSFGPRGWTTRVIASFNRMLFPFPLQSRIIPVEPAEGFCKRIHDLLPVLQVGLFEFHQVLEDRDIDERARHPPDLAGVPEDPRNGRVLRRRDKIIDIVADTAGTDEHPLNIGIVPGILYGLEHGREFHAGPCLQPADALAGPVGSNIEKEPVFAGIGQVVLKRPAEPYFLVKIRIIDIEVPAGNSQDLQEMRERTGVWVSAPVSTRALR